MTESKRTWHVTLPVTGIAFVEVEADDEQSAINEAMSICTSDHLESWQTHDKIVQGNFFHGELNEASAEEISGPDDEDDE